MKIEHIAIWTLDLEKMKDFYLKFFDLEAGEKYYNPQKEFQSYFLSFESEARIELMHITGLTKNIMDKTYSGFAHLSISVGSMEKVDSLTEEIRQSGYQIIDEPRTTGDGYYESVVSDPEGNWIEITV